MADHVWIGRAAKVPQEDVCTIGGTWSASDDITITLNSGTILTLTIGSTDIDVIGTDLVYMLTGNGSLNSASTVRATGSNTAEFRSVFRSVVYDSAANTVTVTGPADGRPFTATWAETSAAGTVSNVTTSGTPAGPHDFTNTENFLGGAILVDGGNLIFDERAQASPKYNISQGGVTPAAIEISAKYIAKGLSIGLPDTNTDDASFPFAETLNTDLLLGDTLDATNMVVHIGRGGTNSGSGFINLNFNSSDSTITVHSTGVRGPSGQAPLKLIPGTGTNTLEIFKGDVEVGTRFAATSTIDTVLVAYTDNPANDVKLKMGDGITSIATFTQTGGVVESFSPLGTTTNIYGGLCRQREGAMAASTVNLQNATLEYMSADTLATLNVFDGGRADFSKDVSARTVTNIELYAGSWLNDTHGTLNSGTPNFDLHGCTLQQVTLIIQVDKRVTLGTIA